MKLSTLARLVAWMTLAQALPATADHLTPPGDERLACRPTVDADAASRGIAITLAGGGTKAASFAMGVLGAAVATPLASAAKPDRPDTLFWQADAVSSVSGGSYAAFYLYSRLIRSRGAADDAAQDLGRYFRDCIPAQLKGTLSAGDGRLVEAEARARGVDPEVLFCPPNVSVADDALNAAEAAAQATARAAARRYWNETQPDTRHQQFFRCHADILTWQRCEFGNSVGARIRSATADAALVGVSALSLPMAWIANTLFDWPVNLSPSRMVYREGIGMAYGLEPLDARALEGDAIWAAQVGAVRYFVTDDGQTNLAASAAPRDDEGGIAGRGGELRLRPDPARLSFGHLDRLYTDGGRVPPQWIINATAAPSRSILGWTGQNDTNFDRDIFHMSGAQQCAGGVGAIRIDRAVTDVASVERNASLLSAVNASAAFFDANQRVYGQPARFLVGLGLHVANLNWGIDALNVDETGRAKTSDIRRGIHLALPVPLYLGESYAAYVARRDPVYVRLVDGGSSDNLGAYGPIVDGVKDVIVSDHAQDRGGSMGDLCLLRNELLIRRGLHLHVPGLAGWPRGCLDEHVLRRSRMRAADTTPAAQAAFDGLERIAGELDAAGLPRTLSYPIWGWPYPFLAGCVSGSDDPDSCLHAPLSRLWIIKPAFDYPHWLGRQNPVDPADGMRRLVSCGGDGELPCEASAFLARLLRDDDESFDSDLRTPVFPQDSTVKMTINSNANLVGAYRELGRHYTRLAAGELDRVRGPEGERRFGALLCWQAARPIVGAPTEKSFRLAAPAFTDLSLDGWSLEARDQARYSRARALPDCATLGLAPLR